MTADRLRKGLELLKLTRDGGLVAAAIEAECAQLVIAGQVAQLEQNAEALLTITFRMRQLNLLRKLLSGRLSLGQLEADELTAAADALQHLGDTGKLPTGADAAPVIPDLARRPGGSR